MFILISDKGKICALFCFAAAASGCGTVQGSSLAPINTDSNPATNTRIVPAQKSRFMAMGEKTQGPYGWYRFCNEEPGSEVLCARVSHQREIIVAAEGIKKHLKNTTFIINKRYEPKTDQENYGISERWKLPNNAADCEDYALQKMLELLQMKFPGSALLMTVVRDEKGEGHAVLTASTSEGDYILDNKTEELKLWSDTPYTFIMVQSPINAGEWLSLGDAGPQTNFQPNDTNFKVTFAPLKTAPAAAPR